MEDEIFDGEPIHIVVQSRAWKGDRPATVGEEHGSMLGARIFINGTELEYATGIRVRSLGGDFVTAQIELAPASITFVEEPREEAVETRLDSTRAAREQAGL